MPTIKEALKQQIQAKAQRIKRFEKRNKHFRQNKIFKEDAKKFYRELGKKKIDVDEPPEPEEVVDFWSNIWEKEKSHNKDSAWIKGKEDLHKDLKAQPWRAINVEETTCAINKSSNWKSPGKDKVSNFWLYKKAFDSVPHTWIIKCMEIYKICPVTVNFIAESMRCWKPTLHLNHAEGSMTSRPINIKSGIFQGDSLSLSTPILSCPSSTELITKCKHLWL